MLGYFYSFFYYGFVGKIAPSASKLSIKSGCYYLDLEKFPNFDSATFGIFLSNYV